MAEKENNSSKLNKLNWLIYIAIIMLIIVQSFYFYNFNNGFSSSKADWGSFGDFVGGTLNPIFAFFSLMAIIYTIKIQTQELEFSREELEETRKELKESRIAQQEQSESLSLQNKGTQLQIFENTFFSLLSNTNSLLEKINVEEDNQLNSRIVDLIEYSGIPKNTANYNQLTDKFENINKGFVKRYFIMLYQLLKFINENEYIEDKKKYTNIVRANIESRVLSLLLINCSIYNYTKYQKYLKDSSFFEHLNLDENYKYGNHGRDYDLGLLIFLIENEYNDKRYFGESIIFDKINKKDEDS